MNLKQIYDLDFGKDYVQMIDKCLNEKVKVISLKDYPLNKADEEVNKAKRDDDKDSSFIPAA